jgi:ABC-2 type transport system ATP-binding protein
MNSPQSRLEHWGVRDLLVRIGGRAALEGVSFEVAGGEIVAVVGGDGAGKTTLLRALVGAIPVASGSVSRPPDMRLGYVSAAPGGYGDLTVDENLEFSAGAYGINRSTRASRIAELLERAQLTAARGRLAEHLSGGMRRKLAVAMAVVHHPALLVLDEPSTGIDPVGRAELWRLLSGLAAEGTAIVFSTTYLDEAERAVRVLVLSDGIVLLAGTPDELLAGIPGSIGESAARPESGMSWRHGSAWRTWSRDRDLPARLRPVKAGLEEAVIVAELARQASTVRMAGSTQNQETAE